MKYSNRVNNSPNFRNGSFQNLSPTPMFPDDVTYYKVIRDALKRPKEVKPSKVLPSQKTYLKNISAEKPVIVWFGHSSYFIHVKGINILVDPVFSGHASPIAGMVKAFAGADVYAPEDFPVIDIMIITHNHYDHLDKKTIGRFMPATKHFYTALGVGRDIKRCLMRGEKTQVTELDWWETEKISNDSSLTALPARHFSGRGLKRGGSLWASFVLQVFGYTIYIGGDSGYDTHFKKIGEQYGPFDIAVLECGQYNESWPFIHMMPEQTVQAAVDLKAKLLLPVHWGKFTLANHPWDDSIKRALIKAEELHQPITTPMIGEPVIVGEPVPVSRWWEL